jgi:hypothetical protein
MMRVTDSLHEDQCTRTYLNKSLSIILGIRNVSEKFCKENQNTQFMFNNILLLQVVLFMR